MKNVIQVVKNVVEKAGIDKEEILTLGIRISVRPQYAGTKILETGLQRNCMAVCPW